MKVKLSKEIRDYSAFRRTYVMLEYARLSKRPLHACREFNVPKSTFYEWKRRFDAEG
ncbi:MAG: hypothetical protein ISR95_09350 [Candidatus Marinimicrobia bacterium]|nr:hypothetical protein [Candidatus Neomarinimicrobiota bacterium]